MWPSGIPTFRGQSSSWWAGVLGLPVMAFFGTTYGWKRAPSVAWTAYNRYMRTPVLQAEPNDFHKLGPLLINAGKKGHVVTENVDGLHQKAGMPANLVCELHGTLWKNVCIDCLRPISEETPPSNYVPSQVPYCSHCGGWPRPCALLFSTSFAQEDLCLPYEDEPYIGHRDNTVVIVAGLSGTVKTADRIIRHYTMLLGAQKCFNINPGESTYDTKMSITPIKAPCEHVAKEIILHLQSFGK